MNDASFTRMRQVTCLVVLVAATPLYAEEALGRLFFTPERRQALDQQRQYHIQEKHVVPEDPTLTIKGVVTRSSGKRTVWINGVAQSEREMAGGVAVVPVRKSPGSVVVEIGELQEARASVGDTVNRNTGEVSSVLNGGRILLRSNSGR